jgi:hypothetical protein
MSRRLLELCLLAYPRARRERDREYLRDLALELAETDGLARQAGSLVLGGIRDRLRRGAWVRRTVAGSLVLAALVAAAASGLIGSDGGRVSELEQFSCRDVADPPSLQGGCAQTRRLVTARERAGWECTTRAGRQSTTWECTHSSWL